MNSTVEILKQDIGSIEYWRDPDKQKKTRSKIKRALTLSGIAQLKEKRERIAVEMLKLAKNRHESLLKDPENES